MTQNKKRKQAIYSDDNDGKMVDDQENIESVLFDEMTEVNSKLISIENNFKLIDNLYFAKNNGMIDEFIGNMKLFIEQLETHRKKVALEKLNSDILSHVYQFLDTKILINCCGLVCKLRRGSLTGLKVKVREENVPNFSHSSLINHVTKLHLTDIKKNTSAFMTLSNCTNLNQLKMLDLSFIKLDSESIEYLMKCNMPNLTELKLTGADISEKDSIELVNNSFISTIKKLDLSRVTEDFTNNFHESCAESKYLKQITHLKICNSKPQIGKRIDLLLETFYPNK